MNKEERKLLIEKYLNVDTDIRQEQMLAQWFAAHRAEADEEIVARMILAEHPEAGYDAGEKEFDRLTTPHKKHISILRWACGVAACVAMVVGAGAFLMRPATPEFNGQEVAESIVHIMSLDMNEVESVTAHPVGDKIIITVTSNDGNQCSYLMSKDENAAISITAMND